LILAATTGEGLTLDAAETGRLVMLAAEVLADAGRPLPLLLGLSGSDTRKMVKTLGQVAAWPIDGTLIACPSYTRPSQEGMVRHFGLLAAASERPMLIYNIPYRTGVNLGNAAMLDLAARHPLIRGVKDCSADLLQSMELLRLKPPGFAVLTGEDALFHPMLTQGAEGGILASAHVETREFSRVLALVRAGEAAAALAAWRDLAALPRLLFAEPSPAPIKHWLWRAGLIDSPEVRLPMTGVSPALAARIDAEAGLRGRAG
jgi:4-hydroxy-tetrahydrodipicolinate synthase